MAGSNPPEFAASGVPVAGRGARTDEALAVLVRLLSGERVTAEGQFGRSQVLVEQAARPGGIRLRGAHLDSGTDQLFHERVVP